jgi:hypothetical protein
MTATDSDLSERIDVIERGYEYLLAYAAQGRQEESGSEARVTLARIYSALDMLRPAAENALASAPSSKQYDLEPFLDALERDARTARSAIGLALSRPSISSMLVDNLNASVHLRALLTDVFLLEQALKVSQP